MKKKFVQFILLITFMMLINLIAHLISVSFIDRYNKNVYGDFHFFDSLIFISIYSFFQIFVFPIHKKCRIFIIPLFTLLLFSFVAFSDDPDGYGFECVHIIVSLTSKTILLFSFIADGIISDLIRFHFMRILYSLGYSLYLLAVFSSFKYIMKCLGSKCPLLSLKKNTVKPE